MYHIISYHTVVFSESYMYNICICIHTPLFIFRGVWSFLSSSRSDWRRSGQRCSRFFFEFQIKLFSSFKYRSSVHTVRAKQFSRNIEFPIQEHRQTKKMKSKATVSRFDFFCKIFNSILLNACFKFLFCYFFKLSRSILLNRIQFFQE